MYEDGACIQYIQLYKKHTINTEGNDTGLGGTEVERRAGSPGEGAQEEADGEAGLKLILEGNEVMGKGGWLFL